MLADKHVMKNAFALSGRLPACGFVTRGVTTFCPGLCAHWAFSPQDRPSSDNITILSNNKRYPTTALSNNNVTQQQRYPTTTLSNNNVTQQQRYPTTTLSNNKRNIRPERAKAHSPGQSEAAPWVANDK